MKTNWLWTIALGGVISSTCGSAIAFFPAVAQAASHTAQTGNVKATLSYELDKSSEAKDLRLRIERQGKILFDQVPSPALPQEEGIISGGKPLTYEQNPLKVRDLDRDREPDVFFDMFTGGAHCCVYTVFYRYNPQQQRYDASTHFWGDLGYRLQDLNQDGQMEFVSGDPRFAYAFASFAGSGFPLQIWNYRQGKMVDVTRQYPKRVKDDAYRWWKIYQEQKATQGELKGILATYMATKYLLGESRDGWQRLRASYREPDAEAFFEELQTFLTQLGYAR